MAQILKKNKDIVVPGEIIAKGMDFVAGNGTYRLDDKIISSLLGLVNIGTRVIKIIPLSGAYMPKKGDMIIAKVIDITISGWRIDFGSPYTAMLSLKEATNERVPKGGDLTKILNVDDYIVAKIINVTSQNLVDVTLRGPGLRKITEGFIIKVNPYKIPRIIGKQGSMINILKQKTNCKIIAGQNGWIWIKGKPEEEVILIKAIRKIELESHLEGLTDNIKNFIEKLKNKNKKN